jgi:type 1 fimbria pilin
MADNRRQYDLTIDVLGRLDPSLIQTINETEARLKELGASTKTQNVFMGQVYKEAFSGMGASAKKEFEEATKQANKFNDFMANVKSTFTGVFAADTASKFFDVAIAGAQKLGEAMKEASNIAGNMELQKAELGIDLQFPEDKMKQFTQYLWAHSAKVPVNVAAQMETSRLLSTTTLETDPQKKMDYIIHEKEMLEDLSAATVPAGEMGQNAVAKLNEHLTEIAKNVTNMQKYGISLERNLLPLENAGLLIRPMLAAKEGLLPEGVTPENMLEKMNQTQIDEVYGQLAKMIKKRDITESTVMDILYGQDQKGGKFFGAADKISKTTPGVESSTQDVYLYFMTKLGEIENGPLKTFLDKINSGFANSIPGIEKFFDTMGQKMSPSLNQAVDKFTGTLGKQDWSKVQEELGKIIDDLPKFIDKMKPIMDWFAKDLPDEINTLLRFTHVIEEVGTAIEKAFGWMLNFNLAKPATPADIQAAKDKAAAGGHVDAAPNRSNYLNDADYGKAMDRFNKQPHLASGGIVTGPTRALIGEAGPEAIIPLAFLSDSPMVRATQDSMQSTIALNDTMAKLGETITNIPQLSPGYGFGGAGGGYDGGGSSSDFTEFGPGVPGDEPGGPTYDWNSYHGIGAYGKLRNGDVAMHPDYARSHYHIEPGDTYISDKDHKQHRWMDKTGSKNPRNEDVYKGAQVTVNLHAYAMDTHGMDRVLDEHGEKIANHVRKVFENENSLMMLS